MEVWLSYRPADFLMFSERVYWRLFELDNAGLWPAQLPALLAGLAILVLLLRPRPWSGRVIATLLAGAWGLVAWAFFWQSYASINWAARYVAPLFAAEALLLLAFGLIAGRLGFAVRDTAGRIGAALLIYALLLHPLLAPLAGRPLAGAELFAIAPDPTAIATLGLILTLPRGSPRLLLSLIPWFWCFASWATLQTLEVWQAAIPLAALLLVPAVPLLAGRRRQP